MKPLTEHQLRGINILATVGGWCSCVLFRTYGGNCSTLMALDARGYLEIREVENPRWKGWPHTEVTEFRLKKEMYLLADKPSETMH